MSEINNNNKGKCAVCGIEANQFCSACKLVKYCGVDHQKKHWKIHKLECRPFAIGEAADLGRYLYATRDIAAKTVIFTEAPLIVGPKWFLNEREECNPIVPCVGCYAPIQIGSHNSCPKCHWPACTDACPGLENPKLHGLECPLLMLGPGPIQTDTLKSLLDYYRTDALIVLKCLMLQRKFPKKWIELMDMQSHEIERLGSELYEDVEKRIVSYLMENYIKRLKSLEAQSNDNILPKNNADILHKICGIIETNYMCINLPNSLELSGIFYTACMMEHSCLPNCYFTFDYNNGFKISVIAGRDIKKGEHLKIMYSHMLWGTQMRQEHLQLTKHFLCKCERCSDPTELKTYLSALKCIGSEESVPCGGIQLPQNPLNLKMDWICNKCPVKISSDEVRYLMTQMGEEVETLIIKKPTIQQLDELIDKLSQFLHPNHYHLFNLKHSLVQLYGTQAGYLINELSDELLKKKLEICNELLKVCDALDPYTIRLSLYVGIMLYEKHLTITEISKRILDSKNCDDQQKIAALEDFKFARDCLLRAAEVLKKELDTVNGEKLSDAVIKAISNMDNLITNNPP